MENRWGNSVGLYFSGLQNHCRWWLQWKIKRHVLHEIKRHLLLGSKIMTNLESILKSRDITLPTKVHLVKAMVFPVAKSGLSITNSQSPPKPMSIESVMPSNHLIRCRPLLLNLSQHHGLFKWVSSSHQVAKVLEFHPQNQTFQWTPRVDPL